MYIHICTYICIFGTRVHQLSIKDLCFTLIELMLKNTNSLCRKMSWQYKLSFFRLMVLMSMMITMITFNLSALQLTTTIIK